MIDHHAALDVETTRTLQQLRKFPKSKRFKLCETRPRHPLFEGATADPKRAIETLKKGAKALGKDPDAIDFTGSRFDIFSQEKKEKFDWNKEKIDLKDLGEGGELGMRMKKLEKSFRAHFVKNNESNKKNFLKGTGFDENEQDKKEDESGKAKSYNNTKLMSSEMLALKDKKEATVMLKEELKESNLRVKAVKQGHSVNEISAQFSNAFYMPDKGKYAVHPPKPH